MPVHVISNSGTSSNVSLHDLIRNNAPVETLQTYPNDVESYKDGLTPLHVAVLADRIDVIFWLLSKKVSVDIKTSSDETALYLAARNGNDAIAGILFASGANIEAENGVLHWRALHAAAFHGHKQLCEFLIAKGANVVAQTSDGQDALQLAGYHAGIRRLIFWRFPQELQRLHMQQRLDSLRDSGLLREIC